MLQYLNQGNFEETLQENDVVLIDFYADWCGPCKALQPALENLSQEFDGKVTIAKVNVDQNPGLSQKFGVRSIPALFYFKKGEVAGKQVGLQTQHVIAQNLNQLLAS